MTSNGEVAQEIQSFAQRLGELDEAELTDFQSRLRNFSNDITHIVIAGLFRRLEMSLDLAKRFPLEACHRSDAKAWLAAIPKAVFHGGLPSDEEADEEMAILIAEFEGESAEYLAQAESALLALEENPEDAEAIDAIFRAFHTIKGVAALLGFLTVSGFAHLAESLFSSVRSKELTFSSKIASLALRSVDQMREMTTDVSSLARESDLQVSENYFALIIELQKDYRFEQVVNAPASSIIPKAPPSATISLRPSVSPRAVEQLPVPVEDMKKVASSAVRTKEETSTNHRDSSSNESWIKIRTDRLDSLLDTVGELVIIQSMVISDPELLHPERRDLMRKITRGQKIIRQLQDMSLSLRMVPLRPSLQKLNRVVRDTAQKTGKTVNFVMDGADTEIDRSMVDVIGDPLVHMMRNAIDHGLESTEERILAGKPAEGRISLRAFHASGSVVIELKDDGRGLDPQKLREKAISKGIISADEVLTMAETFGLIFRPGFSTAAAVTDISGRGVGMDVVRRAIESLNGRIDVSSVLGEGTTFSLYLPLTLAITDGMLVKVGSERYIVPTVSIEVSFRPSVDAIRSIGGRGELVLLRGEPIPMFRLHRLFGIRDAEENPCLGLVIVMGEGQERVAYLVDGLLGQQQAVTKTLGEGLGRVPGVLGGTILNDGRVGLILDPPGLTALARQDAGEKLLN